MKYSNADIIINSNKMLYYFINTIETDLVSIKSDNIKSEKAIKVLLSLLDDKIVPNLKKENIEKIETLLVKINNESMNVEKPSIKRKI